MKTKRRFRRVESAPRRAVARAREATRRDATTRDATARESDRERNMRGVAIDARAGRGTADARWSREADGDGCGPGRRRRARRETSPSWDRATTRRGSLNRTYLSSKAARAGAGGEEAWTRCVVDRVEARSRSLVLRVIDGSDRVFPIFAETESDERALVRIVHVLRGASARDLGGSRAGIGRSLLKF